ncbi:MAG: glycosyltransferase family 4 protein [Desulfobacteraceae bacterium]|nr:glycosyltransferase [Desulfobacteraceae bacterium]MBC2756757.1 glycosyltransferase family 4 protein [Desulfobacteraceae bacterium]
MENIFHTDYKKNALISYLEEPFKNKNLPLTHSNFREVLYIVKLISEFGYNIDLINYLDQGGVNYEKYQLLFGFGFPLENSFKQKINIDKRIFYATGAHSTQRNAAEIYRILALKKRKGTLLYPQRIKKYPDNLSASFSNVIFCTGNNWTISTYRPFFDGSILSVPVSVYMFYPHQKLSRKWATAKKHFLWFGGKGLVHKGLDLCIEAFAKLPEYTLHICGPKEDDFFSVYRRELFSLPNIIFHGYVDISSLDFKCIVETCGYVIFPSCSEGGGGSVLTCMGTGLIPIVTVEASINVNDFGFIIENTEILNIINLVKYVAGLPESDIKIRSQKSYEYVLNHHDFNKFKNNIRNALIKAFNIIT